MQKHVPLTGESCAVTITQEPVPLDLKFSAWGLVSLLLLIEGEVGQAWFQEYDRDPSLLGVTYQVRSTRTIIYIFHLFSFFALLVPFRAAVVDPKLEVRTSTGISSGYKRRTCCCSSSFRSLQAADYFGCKARVKELRVLLFSVIDQLTHASRSEAETLAAPTAGLIHCHQVCQFYQLVSTTVGIGTCHTPTHR